MALHEAANLYSTGLNAVRTDVSAPIDDEMLVALMKGGHEGATTLFFDAYGTYVERLLLRVLGPDPELEDLLHDVFIKAIDGIPRLRDPSRLKAWLSRVTVFVARSTLRRRSRNRWLVFVPPEDLPSASAPSATPEALDLLERVFAILGALRPKHRVAFSLRYIEGMTLPEAADAAGVSLATFKRWLKSADSAFLLRAARVDPALHRELLETPRWRPSHE